MCELDKIAVDNLKEYIKIPSVCTTTDYADCVTFLKKLACGMNITADVVEVKPNRPFVMMKIPGKNSCWKAVVLNSHMDVMPVDECKWKHPPFGAVEEDCKIYGRGIQDMKMQGIQYIEAIRRLKKNCVELQRTIIILFTPDEEMGSQEGMKLFVETCEFKNMNIGFWVDESAASACPRGFILYHGEKHRWCVQFHITGDSGNSCESIENTAAEKMAKLLQIMYDYRKCQFEKGGKDPISIDIVTLNATIVNGGQMEVEIPEEFIVTMDARLPPNVCVDEWKNTLKGWCSQASCKGGIDIKEMICEVLDKPTSIECSNPFYKPTTDTLQGMSYSVSPKMNPTVSDARYIRHRDIPAFGLSMLNGVKSRSHDVDEYIEKDKFIQGIEIYMKLIEAWANTPQC